MTGYGRATADLPDKKLHVEIKSLNSKTMDLSVRFPAAYREKEMEVRTEVARLLERGKVELNVHIDDKDSDRLNAPINRRVVEAYYKQISSIAEQTGIPQPADYWATLLRLPDTLIKEESSTLDEAEWEIAHQTIRQAVDELIAFRKQEGEALQLKFTNCIQHIAQRLAEVEPYEKERVNKIRERIVDNLQRIIGTDYDSNRLEQELIYYIEKLDINEEKQRLTNHLHYFIDTMNGPVGQGKKLGFIAQEMGREINTLGSKSNQAEMQRLVVQMKDELEQIKEQVLNVL